MLSNVLANVITNTSANVTVAAKPLQNRPLNLTDAALSNTTQSRRPDNTSFDYGASTQDGGITYSLQLLASSNDWFNSSSLADDNHIAATRYAYGAIVIILIVCTLSTFVAWTFTKNQAWRMRVKRAQDAVRDGEAEDDLVRAEMNAEKESVRTSSTASDSEQAERDKTEEQVSVEKSHMEGKKPEMADSQVQTD